MARFVHLNGPPGIGKSTLSALYVDRHPGTLNLDVDAVHRLVGGWQDEENLTWQVVWPLIRAMAAAHLGSGRDVVMPQYLADIDRITTFENLARENGATFREIVLLDERESSFERFERRAQQVDDLWVLHHHGLVLRQGGDQFLGAMYDQLLAVLSLRPEAVVVRSVNGAVEQTYELFTEAAAPPG